MTSKGKTGRVRRLALLLASIAGVLVLCGGMALAATITCQAGVDCLGTNDADTLEGTTGQDIMHARGGADTLKGFGDRDPLYGQGGKDTLLGGPEKDYLYGGLGNDALKGGKGDDHYYFGDGWGRDTITDTADPDTEVAFYNDTNGGGPATVDVIVDLRSGVGPEAKDASGTNTINWDGNIIDRVFSGDGDDQITGNASGNVIFGNGGADTIFGGDGDDWISIADGSATDTVHCGPGDDSVSYDVVIIATSFDDIASDCEHLDPE